MGCDINLFVEYKQYDNWYPYGYAELHLSRNYLMFGMMAKGVRTNPKFSFEPKGLPEDISTTTRGENRLYISDKEGIDYANLESAKRYEKYGEEIIYQNGEPTWVTHPDWHTHSWLTKKEYDQVIQNYKKEADREVDVEYLALQSILQTFVNRGYKTRIVFWFDN